MVQDLCECDDDGDAEPSNCCYVSERGACSKRPLAGRRYCSIHTCPACGNTKASREPDPGAARARASSARGRSQKRGSTKGGKEHNVVVAVRARNSDMDKVRVFPAHAGVFCGVVGPTRGRLISLGTHCAFVVQGAVQSAFCKYHETCFVSPLFR